MIVAMANYHQWAEVTRTTNIEKARSSPPMVIYEKAKSLGCPGLMNGINLHVSGTRERRPRSAGVIISSMIREPTSVEVEQSRKFVENFEESQFQVRMKANLDDLKNGSNEELRKLRDECLYTRMARELKVDLANLHLEEHHYRRQVRRFLSGLELSDQDFETLPLQVRYIMRCDVDRFFLKDFELVNHFTPKQAEEFKLLRDLASPGWPNPPQVSDSKSAGKDAPNKQKRRRVGRPKAYDANKDKRLFEGWKASGFRTFAEFARAKNIRCKDVADTVQRVRWRNRNAERNKA
jgi:hypothetical protein